MILKRRFELPLPAGLAATLLLAAAAGCSSNNNPGAGANPDGGTVIQPGGGTITQATKVTNSPADFYVPFDAIPSPDAQTVYFLAVAPAQGAAVFKVAAAGGAVTPLVSGVPLSSPVSIGISTDGNTLYCADPSGWTDNDLGAIFSVSTAGSAGTPTELKETDDYSPRTLVVSRQNNADVIYFAGNDKADGIPGIFTDIGGTVTPILKGANLDPTALAVSSTGIVYYLDSAHTESQGNLFKVTSATAGTQIGTAQNLQLNFPGGMALTLDESAVVTPALVSQTAAANAGGTNFARIDVNTGVVTMQSAGSLTDPLVEPGGLHRALNSDRYSYVDLGANQSGTVYLLSK